LKTEGVSHDKTGAYLQVDAIAQKPWLFLGTHRQSEFLGRTPELFNSSGWRYNDFPGIKLIDRVSMPP